MLIINRQRRPWCIYRLGAGSLADISLLIIAHHIKLGLVVRHVLYMLYYIRIAHMYRISQSLYIQHIDKGSHGQTSIWWSAVPSTNHYYSHHINRILLLQRLFLMVKHMLNQPHKRRKCVTYVQDSLSLEGISGRMRSDFSLRTDVNDDICT